MKVNSGFTLFLGRRAAVAASLLLAGCGTLQKDIDVPLPNYRSELVVECYLEPGRVPQLTVTESVPYLASALPSVPRDVTVDLILPGGQRVPLTFAPSGNIPLTLDTVTRKFYTHIGRDPLVAHAGDTFGLDVRDGKGRHVTASATMTALVPIDSVEFKFNDKPRDEQRAYFITSFRDPSSPDDYYRLQLHKHDSIYSRPEVDQLLDDRLNNGNNFPVGTTYRFYHGDTITSTLYHLDPAYYRFRRSVRDARNANGNPFAQPAAIQSTVQGGLGVFTILNYSRRRIVLR